MTTTEGSHTSTQTTNVFGTVFHTFTKTFDRDGNWVGPDGPLTREQMDRIILKAQMHTDAVVRDLLIPRERLVPLDAPVLTPEQRKEKELDEREANLAKREKDVEKREALVRKVNQEQRELASQLEQQRLGWEIKRRLEKAEGAIPTMGPYAVLHVQPNAPLEVIEAAYRALSRIYHPDTNHAPGALTRMQQINAAIDQIRREAKR